MCLELRKNSTVRYPSTSRRRWKAVQVFPSHDGTGLHLFAPYQEEQYALGKWIEAEGPEHDPESFGFHVLMNRSAARMVGNSVLQVEVKGFLRSGNFGRHQCETYRYIRFPKNPKLR